MDIKNRFKEVVFYLILAIFILFFYRCPFRFYFGIDCPGCGLTRAFKSAILLDFKSAFNYHKLYLLIGVELFYVVLVSLKKELRINKKIEITVIIITIILMIIVWIIKIIR